MDASESLREEAVKIKLLLWGWVCLFSLSGCVPMQQEFSIDVEPVETLVAMSTTSPVETATAEVETPEASQTLVVTPTETITATATLTVSVTITHTPLPTQPRTVGTPTPTPTPTSNETRMPVAGATPSMGTPTFTPTSVLTITPTISPTIPVTVTITPTGTVPVTVTPTGTVTVTATPTGTVAPPTATSVPTTTVTPAPTPAPGQVSVRNHRSFREGNTLYVVGEVVNNGTAPIFAVKVIASFYNSDNAIVAVQEGQTFLGATMPTQRSPFKLAYVDAPVNVDRYDLALTWDDISIVTYERVTVLSEEVRNNNGIEVFGELRNDHPFEVTDVQVVVTFYDGEGIVVDVFQGAVNAPSLAPSSTASYTVPTSKAEIQFDSFLVQTQGTQAMRVD